jgi:hypothetical protein
MPPRPAVAVVVLAWLATLGWLAVERWLPWLRPQDEPAFAVELADEVAAQQASWTVYRKGKKVGQAETRMAPRRDGHFELTTRLRDLEVPVGAAEVKVPLHQGTRVVTRTGELVEASARTTMLIRWLGTEVKVEATTHGGVDADTFEGTVELDLGAGRTVRPLGPSRLVSGAPFAPFEPLLKYPPLRPRQTWRTSAVDPLGEAVNSAVRLAAARVLADAVLGKAPAAVPGRRPPADLLAQVLAETEDIPYRGHARPCRVIVFLSDEPAARVWVDLEDGKVLRQEAAGFGDPLVLQRD